MEGERSFTLPPPGWMPDPSEIGVERYWDGRSWTPHTRLRASGMPVAAFAEPSRPSRNSRFLSGWPFWTAVVVVVGILAASIVVEDYPHLNPFAPSHESLAASLPNGDEVPVFGTTELSLYLASQMAAQTPVIDVTAYLNPTEFSFDELEDTVLEVLTQNPYVFVTTFRMSTSMSGIEVVPDYIYSKPEADRRRAATSEAVAWAMSESGVNSASTPREKVHAIHAFLLKQGRYDHEAAAAIDLPEGQRDAWEQSIVDRSQEAYGILVEGVGVCTAYAEAFLLLAHAAGLEAVVVTGLADRNDEATSHAWNRVKIDDEWLVVDATWDDAGWSPRGATYLLLAQDSHLLQQRHVDEWWARDDAVSSYS